MSQREENPFEEFKRRATDLERQRWNATKRVVQASKLRVFPFSAHVQSVDANVKAAEVRSDISWVFAMREAGVPVNKILEVMNIRDQLMNSNITSATSSESEAETSVKNPVN